MACGRRRDRRERTGRRAGESSRHGTPYAGLSAFQPEDADRFFGRERLTEEVLAKVRDHRFPAAFGPSGAGKSSPRRGPSTPSGRRDRR
ncbi:nSTAND1 domain-containing NTPase [Streptomyces sp. NPDC004050]